MVVGWHTWFADFGSKNKCESHSMVKSQKQLFVKQIARRCLDSQDFATIFHSAISFFVEKPARVWVDRLWRSATSMPVTPLIGVNFVGCRRGRQDSQLVTFGVAKNPSHAASFDVLFDAFCCRFSRQQLAAAPRQFAHLAVLQHLEALVGLLEGLDWSFVALETTAQKTSDPLQRRPTKAGRLDCSA